MLGERLLVIMRLLKIFLLGLWLGATVFGGIAAAYPVIRERAENEKWLTGDEVDALYAVAVILPGPSFMNLWGSVAARVAGFPGAIAAQFGLILPAFLLVCLLPFCGRISFVAAHKTVLLQGVTWATTGLLVSSGIEGLRKQKSNSLKWLTPAAFGLLITGLHPLIVLGAGICIGLYVKPSKISLERKF